MVFQHYAAFKHMTVWDNVAFGLTIRKRPKAEISRAGRTSCSSSSSSRGSRSAIRHSSRAASASGWRSPARSRSSRSVLLLDEPFGALDARVRKELRAWLRRLHDEVHVTTIIVTHDQEEAMEVAGQIVVLNDGRIEQVGSPRELYEQPANEFVMSFVGPVNRARRHLRAPSRPRGALEPDGRLGRRRWSSVSSTSASRCGSSSSARTASTSSSQLTQEEAEQLELERGQIVYVRPRHSTVFSPRSVRQPGVRVGGDQGRRCRAACPPRGRRA